MDFIKKIIYSFLIETFAVVIIIGAIFLWLLSKNDVVRTSLVFIITQLTAILLWMFQMRLKSKNDFKIKLFLQNFDVLNQSYEKLDKVNSFVLVNIKNIAYSIKHIQGVRFHTINVNDESNKYLIDLRKKFDNYLYDLYSTILPTCSKLSKIKMDHRGEYFNKTSKIISDKIRKIIDMYNKSEENWSKISYLQKTSHDNDDIDDKFTIVNNYYKKIIIEINGLYGDEKRLDLFANYRRKYKRV